MGSVVAGTGRCFSAASPATCDVSPIIRRQCMQRDAGVTVTDADDSAVVASELLLLTHKKVSVTSGVLTKASNESGVHS